MQQVTYVSSGQIEVRDVPSARLQDSADALIEPLVVATCDLDTAMVRGKSPFPGPFPLGHEGVGRVTDIGDQVDHFTPGELVSIPFQISCGACERCRLGHTAHCTGHGEAGPQFFGIGPTGVTWGGFLSDSVRVPFADQMLVGVPEGVHPEAIASLSDNISDGYRAVAPALEASPRATVLVVGGGGSIGLYAAGVALALGAERVDYLDVSPDRLEIAERLGAQPVQVDELLPERLGPYPVTVDSSSRPEGLRLAVRSTDQEGTCTSTSIYWESATLPLLEMYTAGITFKTGLAHVRTCMPEVLDLVSSGKLHPELVTGRRVGWEDAAEALVDVDLKLVISRLESTA